MVWAIEETARSAVIFRNEWNRNLLRRFEGETPLEAEAIYQLAPTLLQDGLLAEVQKAWEEEGGTAEAEVYGFVLRHQIVHELLPEEEAIRNACQRFATRCEELTGDDFWALQHQLLGVPSEEQMRRRATEVLEDSEETHRAYLQELTGSVAPSVLEIEALLDAQIRRSAPLYHPTKIRETYETLKGEMGVDVPVEVHAPRRTTTPVVLLLRGRVMICFTMFGGREDLRAMLHMAGHAIHFAATHAPVVYQHLFNITTSESFAFLLQWLVADPTFNAHVEDVRWEQFLILHGWRRQAALYLYHDHVRRREWKPDPVAYQDLMRRAVGDGMPTALAWHDLDYRLLCLQFLRAFDGTVALRGRLRERYGKAWWSTPGAGRELLDLCRRGTALTIDEFMRSDTGCRLEEAWRT